MRILEGAAAESYVRKLEQRGQKLDALEPQVRRIVESVRRDGDRALRRYAERWDGLSSAIRDALRVSESEMQAALKASSPELRAALEAAADRIRKFCEWQKIASGSESKQGRKLGTIGASARFRRMLRSRGTLSHSLNFADDGDSGASCRRERYPRGFSASGTGDSGGRSTAGSARVLPRRGRAGDRSFGVRHKNHCPRRQDRWAWKFVRDYGEENRRL